MWLSCYLEANKVGFEIHLSLTMFAENLTPLSQKILVMAVAIKDIYHNSSIHWRQKFKQLTLSTSNCA